MGNYQYLRKGIFKISNGVFAILNVRDGYIIYTLYSKESAFDDQWYLIFYNMFYLF